MDYMTFKKKKEFQEFCYLTLEFTIKMSIKEEWCHCRGKPVDQWNRTETPAINSHISNTGFCQRNQNGSVGKGHFLSK